MQVNCYEIVFTDYFVLGCGINLTLTFALLKTIPTKLQMHHFNMVKHISLLFP